MAKSAPTSKPPTPSTADFQQSVHLIPTPGLDGKRPQRFNPLIYKWFAWGFHSGVMIVIAIAIEVVAFFSNRNGGFKVHEKNVFSFGGLISSQFLLSFFPTLFIAPLTIVMNGIWFWFRVYQPYITLAEELAHFLII